MSKPTAPPPPAYFGPPPAAPPSYSQAVGGVPPSAPFQQYGKGPTIVTTVVPVVGPNPTRMVCPHCRAEIETLTVKTPSLVAWLSGAIIALLGFWCGCCFIPCCIDSCMDVDHSCPNCNAYLGHFKR